MKLVVKECDFVLRESDIWECNDKTNLWHAKESNLKPSFYPIYQWQNYYSYSIFALIKFKQSLSLNYKAAEFVKKTNYDVIPSDLTIDREIKRVGGPHECSFDIKDVNEYIEKLHHALLKDIDFIETKNNNKTNVILCGGKDSLNLLLLPWRNKTIAYSAKPNFDLVKQFIVDNKLDIECFELVDKEDKALLSREKLENCCRADLSQWKWTAHLVDIAKKHNREIVFWKGQLGDLYMDETWKRYIFPTNFTKLFFRKIYKKLSNYLPNIINTYIGHKIQPSVISASWNKSATMQGSHLGFLRSMTNCLVLSSYHGKYVRNVISKADLSRVANTDIRHLLGEKIAGRKVVYPVTNPGPKPSSFREGLSSVDEFMREIKNENIKLRQ